MSPGSLPSNRLAVAMRACSDEHASPPVQQRLAAASDYKPEDVDVQFQVKRRDKDGLEPLPVPVVRQAMDPRPIPAAWDWG